MLKEKIKSASLLVSSLVIVMSATAFAADGKALYDGKGCAGCHGADGKTSITPAYPKIAGQNKEYIEQQLKDFKSGARTNGQAAIMKGIMAAVSEEEITVLAEYLSGLE